MTSMTSLPELRSPDADLLADPDARAAAGIPDLFIIGAAKAATSSLKRWLGDHPEIYTSEIDESRVLMDAHDPLARADGYAVAGLGSFRRHFPPERRPAGTVRMLDATPMYYYQDTARAVIPAIAGSRVIFVARQPGRRLKSLYDFAQNNIGALPADLSFDRFVDEMRKGKASPILGRYPMMYNGLQHSNYAHYLRDWIAAMGAERVSVLIFEEMVAAPERALMKLSRDLGIDDGFYRSYAFPRENESFVVSNRFVHKMALGVRRRLPLQMRNSVKSFYSQIKGTPRARPRPKISDADRETMRRIDRDLAPWEAELAQLLGRETIWAAPVDGAASGPASGASPGPGPGAVPGAGKAAD